jgi:hypothetical protein
MTYSLEIEALVSHKHKLEAEVERLRDRCKAKDELIALQHADIAAILRTFVRAALEQKP